MKEMGFNMVRKHIKIEVGITRGEKQQALISEN